jgi:hypothetical protein
MRIVIDLQSAQTLSRHRGIGRYSLSLAKAMIEKGTGHEFILALNGRMSDGIAPSCRPRTFVRGFLQVITRRNCVVWQTRRFARPSWHPFGPI